jgi:protein-S-isoprenylcysteine O-methyltransferase Ste14
VKLNLLTLAVLIGIVLGAAIATAHPPWTPLRIAGLVIGLPSMFLLAIARWQLGLAFSVRPKATHLVTRGLYSRLRNPIYVFGGLSILGCILYFDQLWFLLVLPITIPLQIARARQEAKALEEEFGEQYRQYRAQTWF